jgi:hypothetical protein
MNIKITASIAGISFLAACANPAPLVSDYNGDSVKISQVQIAATSNPEDPAVVSEATRICGTTGRRAEYASTRYNPATYEAVHLFLCLKR